MLFRVFVANLAPLGVELFTLMQNEHLKLAFKSHLFLPEMLKHTV